MTRVLRRLAAWFSARANASLLATLGRLEDHRADLSLARARRGAASVDSTLTVARARAAAQLLRALDELPDTPAARKLWLDVLKLAPPVWRAAPSATSARSRRRAQASPARARSRRAADQPDASMPGAPAHPLDDDTHARLVALLESLGAARAPRDTPRHSADDQPDAPAPPAPSAPGAPPS